MATRRYLTLRTTVLLLLAVVVVSQIVVSWYNTPMIKGVAHPSEHAVHLARSHHEAGERAVRFAQEDGSPVMAALAPPAREVGASESGPLQSGVDVSQLWDQRTPRLQLESVAHGLEGDRHGLTTPHWSDGNASPELSHGAAVDRAGYNMYARDWLFEHDWHVPYFSEPLRGDQFGSANVEGDGDEWGGMGKWVCPTVQEWLRENGPQNHTVVLNVGFDKTATSSWSAAMYRAGWQVAHMKMHFPQLETAHSPEDVHNHACTLILRELKRDARITAYEDSPWFLFYREFLVNFPDSKFVRWARRTESWVASYENFFCTRRRPWHIFLYGSDCASPVPRHRPECVAIRRAVYEWHEANLRATFEAWPHRYLELATLDKSSLEQCAEFLGATFRLRDWPRILPEIGCLRQHLGRAGGLVGPGWDCPEVLTLFANGTAEDIVVHLGYVDVTMDRRRGLMEEGWSVAPVVAPVVYKSMLAVDVHREVCTLIYNALEDGYNSFVGMPWALFYREWIATLVGVDGVHFAVAESNFTEWYTQYRENFESFSEREVEWFFDWFGQCSKVNSEDCVKLIRSAHGKLFRRTVESLQQMQGPGESLN